MIDAPSPAPTFMDRLRTRYGDESAVAPPRERGRSGSGLWRTQSNLLKGTSKFWSELDEKAGLEKSVHVARATYRRNSVSEGLTDKLKGFSSGKKLNW